MVIRGENIKKEYIRKLGVSNVLTAVDTCRLELAPGSMTVVCGRSGSGKTTLLNMLAGILQPSEGRVFYDGTDIYAMDDGRLSVFRNRNIGYIPQGKSAVASLTVRENILLPLTLYGEDDGGEADRLIKRVDLSELRDARPEEMSGGELRRMAIARAMIRKPAVIFADEPTGDLDDENTAAVFRILREAADWGAAVMVVTHEGEAAGYADHMYRMDKGVLCPQMKGTSEIRRKTYV